MTNPPSVDVTITWGRPTVIPAGTLKEGQVIRVTLGGDNVFADLGVPEPERELRIADAYAKWTEGDPEDFLELTPDERAEVEKKMEHFRRMMECSERMGKIHHETFRRLAEDD